MKHTKLTQGIVTFLIIFPLSIINPWLVHLILDTLYVENIWLERLLSMALTVTFMTITLPYVFSRIHRHNQ